jgi:hypothetical protein
MTRCNNNIKHYPITTHNTIRITTPELTNIKFARIKYSVSGAVLYNLIPNYNYDYNEYQINLKYDVQKSQIYLLVNGLIVHSLKVSENNTEKHNNIYYIELEQFAT